MIFCFTAVFLFMTFFQQPPAAIVIDALVAVHGMPPLDGDETIGDTVGTGTGATELRPSPGSSDDPKGTPARPTDDVDAAGFDAFVAFVGTLVVQEFDALPEIPPPSNGAPEDCGPEFLESEQFVFPRVGPTPDGDADGLMPGVAISVDPNGTPTGWTVEPDPKLSGDVAPIPCDELPNPFVCANAGPQSRIAAMTATAHAFSIGIRGRCTRRPLLISARTLMSPPLP
jgi:hypothetical protein